MEKISLGHGSGGRLMHQLIKEHIAPAFGISGLADSAVLDCPCPPGSRLAFTTDSYVVSPIFFPGGDIGDLAVNGTVNDLAMVGARPVYMTTGFIIEEGFPAGSLKRILVSMTKAAEKAGVKIVAGDTKVVDRGKGDGIFINTAGIGVLSAGISLGAAMVRPGDLIIISGTIGNHGVAVMSDRNGISFEPPVVTDSASLWSLVELMMNTEKDIRIMRDPTRGGVATTLKEIALETGLTFLLDEQRLPVPGGVKGACEMLGLDPLYIANEGILLAIVPAAAAGRLVAEMRTHELGASAEIIGEVVVPETNRGGMVLLRTAVGGTRIIDMLAGEQLPRIC